MAARHRTVIAHDSRRLADLPGIWSALGYQQDEPGSDTYKCEGRSLLTLRAAVDLATRDVTSRQWLRTREQVDGGPFPGPWLHLQSRDEVKAFLIEYDVARSRLLSEYELRTQTAALKEDLRSLSRPAYAGMIAQLARTHNYTSLLDKYPKSGDLPTKTIATSPTTSESASTDYFAPKPPVIDRTGSNNEALAPSTPATATTVSTSSRKRPREDPVSNPGSRGRTLATTEATASSLSRVPSRRKVQDLVSQYHRNQRVFEEALYDYRTSVPVAKELFERLFGWESRHDQLERWLISLPLFNYPRICAIIARISGFEPDPEMAETLRSLLFKREEVISTMDACLLQTFVANRMLNIRI